MITVKVKSEFGEYKKKLNHGHDVFYTLYRCTDAYKAVDNHEEWLNCPCCGLKPRYWVFDNGRFTACGCGNSIYDHFSVRAESIMSVHVRTDGKNMTLYDTDELRKNWNEYCMTMINPCSHGDLFIEGKW